MTITRKNRRLLSKLERQKEKWGYIFIAPWLLIFLIFYLYPLIYGVAVSFTDFSFSGNNFIGLDNYRKIVQDYAFWRSLAGTFRYAAITIPISVIVPLWIANTLRPHTATFSTATKLLIYLPSVTCAVAMVIVWNFIFWPNIGMINQILRVFGITNFSIFDNANISIPVIALLIGFTNMGPHVVLYCGALNAVPEIYYEAAELDGASHANQFFHITVPMLQPTIVYTLINTTIGGLQIFVIPKLMTQGGPNYSSSTLLLMIYNAAFENHKFGYASAIGTILFIFTAIIAIIQFRVTRREAVEY